MAVIKGHGWTRARRLGTGAKKSAGSHLPARGEKLAATYSRASYTGTTIGKAAFDGRVRNGNGSGHSVVMSAILRKINGIQYLWTCHHIGVNASGNNNDGHADRIAVEWLRIQTTPTV